MSFRSKASSFIKKTGAYFEGLSETAPTKEAAKPKLSKYVAQAAPKESVTPADAPNTKIRARVTVKPTPLSKPSSSQPNQTPLSKPSMSKPKPTQLHDKVQDPLSFLRATEKETPIPSLKTPLEPRSAPPKMPEKTVPVKDLQSRNLSRLFMGNSQPAPIRYESYNSG